MIRGGSTTYAVRFGSANTPQGHADEIKNPLRKRVQAVADVVNLEGIDILGLQEYGPLLHEHWLDIPGLTAILGPENVVGRGGREVGNGAVYSTRSVYALHTRWLKFRWQPSRRLPSIIRPRLSFIETLWKHRATGGLHVTIIGHIPAARDASERTRKRIHRGIIREAKRLWRRYGIPVVVIFDKNSGSAAEYLKVGFQVVAHDAVDWILVLGADHVSDENRHDGKPWSDRHDLVCGTAHFLKTPAATFPALKRLPRRAAWFRRHNHL